MLGHHQPAKHHLMMFRWRPGDGPLLAVFGSSLPSSTRKKTLSDGEDPVRQYFLDHRMCSTKLSGPTNVLYEPTPPPPGKGDCAPLIPENNAFISPNP